MAPTIYKILLFLKRRPGLSVEAFRDHYENTHVKLAEKYVTPSTLRYFRRFIEPVGDKELPYDVITELWLNDKEKFDAICQFQIAGAPPPDILADEEWLFDRAAARVCTVVEYESDLAAIFQANAAEAP